LSCDSGDVFGSPLDYSTLRFLLMEAAQVAVRIDRRRFFSGGR
jgi:hypothetical protein